MADLGVIPGIHVPIDNPPTIAPLNDYRINRGLAFGAVGIYSVEDNPPFRSTLANYIVRQTRILFRQLWPAHGQRYPQ